MVRPKNAILPEKKVEVEEKINSISKKFDKDLSDLKMAQRNFSSSFVDAMDVEFKKILPKEVLNMKVVDFVKRLNEAPQDCELFNEKEGSGNMNAVTPSSSLPMPRPAYYKSVKTPNGLEFKVPSCITPRFDGKMAKARPSKYGEILFSVRGTPVVSTVTAANLMETKKQEAVIRNLIRQEEFLTPETRKIIGQLKELVKKRTALPAEDESN